MPGNKVSPTRRTLTNWVDAIGKPLSLRILTGVHQRRAELVISRKEANNRTITLRQQKRADQRSTALGADPRVSNREARPFSLAKWKEPRGGSLPDNAHRLPTVVTREITHTGKLFVA